MRHFSTRFWIIGSVNGRRRSMISMPANVIQVHPQDRRGYSPGFHEAFEKLDRVKRVERPVLIFIGLDHHGEQIEAIRVRRARGGGVSK